jgi:hypothetical protein
MIDHSTMRLGKRPRRHDPRTLMLARYLKGALPPAPSSVDYTRGITDWGLMLNDQLGCCTIAAAAHAVQTWTANAGNQEITFPDPVILDYYKTWDGYNPADPFTDQGGVELNVLNDWRQQGFAGQTLDAYAAIDLGTHDTGNGTGENSNPQRVSIVPNPEVMDAIWLFGGAYIGVELPITAQNQDVWDIDAQDSQDSTPGSWGGHAVYLVGYDSGTATPGGASAQAGVPVLPNPGPDDETPVTTPSLSAPPLLNQEGSFAGPSPVSCVPCPGTLTCITWGQLKKMTWAWFAKYCSEAYALVSKDWIEATGISPSGFDLAALEDDLKQVTG